MKQKWTELKGDTDNAQTTGDINTHLQGTDRTGHKRRRKHKEGPNTITKHLDLKDT